MPFELYDTFQTLIERGGVVFVVILLLSTAMWALIIERYWYLYRIHPNKVQQSVEVWQQRNDRSSWSARRIRAGLIVEHTIALQENLLLIHALTATLPLLGLLGTVTGMILIFDVMTTFGTSNVRGFASGISQALLTTIAGLVTSISGLYFSAHLQHRAKLEAKRTSNLLTYDGIER